MKLRKFMALFLTLAMVVPMVLPAVSARAAETLAETALAENSVFYQNTFTEDGQLAGFDLYQSADSQFVISDGALVANGTNGEQKAILKEGGKIKSLSVDIMPGASGVIYGGVYFGANDAQNGQDQIRSQVILIKSDYTGWSDAPNRIDIIHGQFNNGWEHISTKISESGNRNNLFSSGKKEPLNLRLDFSDDVMLLTLSLVSNSAKYVQYIYEMDPQVMEGQVGLRSIGSDTCYDNLIVNHDYVPKSLTQGVTLDGTGLKSYGKTTGVMTQKPVTIEAWVWVPKLTGGSRRQAIITNYTESTVAKNAVGTWGLYTNEHTTLYYTERTSSGTFNHTLGVPVCNNSWNHVAIVRRQGALDIYWNGEFVQTIEHAGMGDPTVVENPMTIGYCSVAAGTEKINSLKGQVGDIRLWSTERTHAQIQDNMYREMTGKEEGLIQHWNFDSQEQGIVSNTVAGGLDVELLGHTKLGIEDIYRWDFSTEDQLNDFTIYADTGSSGTSNYAIVDGTLKSLKGAYYGDDLKAMLNEKIDGIKSISVDMAGGGASRTDGGFYVGVKAVNSTVKFDLDGYFIAMGGTRTSEARRPWSEITFYRVLDGVRTAIGTTALHQKFYPGPAATDKLNSHLQVTFEDGVMYTKMYRLDDPTIVLENTYDMVDGMLDGQFGLRAGNSILLYDNLTIVTETPAEVLPEQDTTTYENDGYNFFNAGNTAWEVKQDIATPYTLEAWVKVPNGIADNTVGFIVGNHYRAPYVSMQMAEDGKLRLAYAVENADLTVTTTNFDVDADLRTGKWTHVAYTCDVEKDTITAYINGKAMKTWKNAGLQDMRLPDHVSPANWFMVGSGKDGEGDVTNQFPGWIADVRLWNKVLSSSELQGSMQAQYTTAQNGLLFNAPLDQLTDDRFADLSGNGNDLQKNIAGLVLETQTHETGAYSMVVIPDPQILSHYKPEKLLEMFQWIADNREKENIQMVMCVGDIVDNCGNIAQWEAIKAAWELLPDDLPFINAPGNHDYDTNSGWNKGYGVREQLTLMNQYFPRSLYENYPTEIGFFDEVNSMNQWQTFCVNGSQYLVMALEYVPQDDVIAWANEVVAAHPNHQVIMVTHSYVGSYGNVTQTKLWNNFLSQHENIIMNFSGHVAHLDLVHRTDKGIKGNDVHQILIDAQMEDVSGAYGMVGMLRFNADGSACDVSYYSTLHDKYESRSNFTLTIDMPEQKGALVGNQSYASVSEAIANANGQVVTLLRSTDEAVTVTADTYLNLAGYDLGHVTVAEGATLYGMDSSTDDYDCSDGYGKIAGITGNYAVHHKTDVNGPVGRILRYLAVEEEDGISFHRFYVGIQSVTLKPGATGFGYKAIFGGDELVKGALDAEEAFGYKLWINADHPVTASKGRTDFISGKNINLLLRNFDVVNHGQTQVYATVYVKLVDGTVVESAEYAYNMKQMVELVNDTYTDFNAAQLNAIGDMIYRNETMLSWRVENILGATTSEYQLISGFVSKDSGIITAAADTLALSKAVTMENGTYFAQINTTDNTRPAGLVFAADEDATSYYLFRLGNGSKVELVKVVDGVETVVDTGYYPANRRKDVFSGLEIVVDGDTIHGYIHNPHYDRVHCFSVHEDAEFAGNHIGLWSAAEGVVFQNLSVSSQTAIRKADVLIFGHSYTEMWTNYQDYFPEYTSIDNMGLGGSVAVQWEQFPEELASYEPKLGIYLIGINDLTGGTTPKAVVTSMEKTLLAIKELVPEFEVVVTAVNHCPNRATITAEISQCNALMRNLAASYDWIYYAETEYALCTDPSDPLSADSSLFSDGLHPNAAGYTILVDAIRLAAKGENQPAFDDALAQEQLAEVKADKMSYLSVYSQKSYTEENWVLAEPYYNAAVAKINACTTEMQLKNLDLSQELAQLSAIRNKAADVVANLQNPETSIQRSTLKWVSVDDYTINLVGSTYSLDSTAVYKNPEGIFKFGNNSGAVGTAGVLLNAHTGSNMGMYGYLINCNTNGNYIQIYYVSNSYNNDGASSATKYIGGIVLNNYGIRVEDTEFWFQLDGDKLYVNTVERKEKGEANMLVVDLTYDGAYEVYESGYVGLLAWASASTYDIQLQRFAAEEVIVEEEPEEDIAAEIMGNLLDTSTSDRRGALNWTKVDDHTIHATGSTYSLDNTTVYSDSEFVFKLDNGTAGIGVAGIVVRANANTDTNKGLNGYLVNVNTNGNYIQIYYLNNSYNNDGATAETTYIDGVVLNNYSISAEGTEFYIHIEGSSLHVNTLARHLAGEKVLKTIDLTKKGHAVYPNGHIGLVSWVGNSVSFDMELSDYTGTVVDTNMADDALGHLLDAGTREAVNVDAWSKVDNNTLHMTGFGYALDNTFTVTDAEVYFTLSDNTGHIGTAGVLLRASIGANNGVNGYLINYHIDSNFIQIFYMNNYYNNDNTESTLTYLGGIVLNNYNISNVGTEFYAKIQGDKLYVNTTERQKAGTDNIITVDLTKGGTYQVYESGRFGLLSWVKDVTFHMEISRLEIK